MRVSLVPLCLVAALGGCQAAPTYPGDSSEHTTVVHSGDAAVSVVGTPFYLAFKGVVCAMSAVIAAPVAGITALSESRFAPKIRDDLGDGLSRNCGPPDVLSPYRVVSVEPAPDVPKMLSPRQPPEASSAVSNVPAPPQPLEPASGMPDVSTLEQPPEPPADYSAAPMTEQFPEPAAGGPIELFNE
jgi:hypothetical protein